MAGVHQGSGRLQQGLRRPLVRRCAFDQHQCSGWVVHFEAPPIGFEVVGVAGTAQAQVLQGGQRRRAAFVVTRRGQEPALALKFDQFEHLLAQVGVLVWGFHKLPPERED